MLLDQDFDDFRETHEIRIIIIVSATAKFTIMSDPYNTLEWLKQQIADYTDIAIENQELYLISGCINQKLNGNLHSLIEFGITNGSIIMLKCKSEKKWIDKILLYFCGKFKID